MADVIPLTQAPAGRPVVVVQVAGGRGVQGRLLSLGIRPGVTVTKVNSTFAGGPAVIQVGTSKTALGRGVCAKIMVEAPG